MEKVSLFPGFRFHPTDEELLSYYLKRKICGRKLDFDAIAEVDLYKYEPWDLPVKSLLQTRDLEWYFFIPRDKKYPNGSRTNRATERGYWKSTGKDRFIMSASRNVGTKKTLVYYNGRAPKGERSNWVMHEYRLNDAECQRINAVENSFVLCRIYQKSGAGPKNGEQYGAPVEDGEFDSPAGEGEGIRFFKPGAFEAGLGSANAYHAGSPATGGSGNEAVSHDDPQFASSDVQPRNLKFADSPATLTPEFHKDISVTHFVSGSTVLPNHGIEGFGPPVCHEDEKILQELYELVMPKDQLEFTDGYQDPTAHHVETGFYQAGALPPNDGDFLELNDLLSVSDCEGGLEAIKPTSMQNHGGLEDFSGESECTSVLKVQAVHPFDANVCNGQWQDLSFGNGRHERQQNYPEAQSLLSVLTFDSQMGGFNDSVPIPSSGVCNEEINAACETDLLEAAYEDVMEFFTRASGDKSFNAEALAENIQRGMFNSGDNLVPSQEGHYYDALLSLTEDMYGETMSATMHTVSNVETPQLTLGQSDVIAEATQEFITESVVVSQNGDIKAPPSPLNIIWSCLGSLPTLPASAEDLSPKAASSEVSSAGRLAKSLSFVGQRRKPSDKWRIGYNVSAMFVAFGAIFWLLIAGGAWKPSDKWRIGYYVSAMFVAFWAIFWLLIAGGAWKLFGGVYRRIVGSET